MVGAREEPANRGGESGGLVGFRRGRGRREAASQLAESETANGRWLSGGGLNSNDAGRRKRLRRVKLAQPRRSLVRGARDRTVPLPGGAAAARASWTPRVEGERSGRVVSEAPRVEQWRGRGRALRCRWVGLGRGSSCFPSPHLWHSLAYLPFSPQVHFRAQNASCSAQARESAAVVSVTWGE